MEENNIAAALFEKAQALQNEARDLHDKVTAIYKEAGQLKALALRAAETLTKEVTA